MRVAIVNWSRRSAGGVEAYLSDLLPELAERGCEVGFWYEVDRPLDRPAIPIPAAAATWCVEELGTERALAALRQWAPTIVYVHSMLDPDLEREVQKIGTSIFFPHAYQGTCISGAKTTSFPVIQPCDRRFGWQCLAHYYPRRCGGLNPLRMWSDYRLQASRLDALRGYDALVTHSTHMRDEYLRHGFAPDAVHQVPYWVHAPAAETSVPADRTVAGKHLAFVGRMDRLKGGGVLLESLPLVRERLGEPLHVTMAGDGPMLGELRRQAAEVMAADGQIRVDFPGWIGGAERDRILRSADLLVVPSLWPEPFGRVGPEAGLLGLPVAAFDVGGISDWLESGVNGRLAPGNPARPEGLANAIVWCLESPERQADLEAAAKRLAQRFTRERHMEALLEVFVRVLDRPRVMDGGMEPESKELPSRVG